MASKSEFSLTIACCSLRALSFPPPHQDVHTLLDHEHVVSILGTDIQTTGTGFDSLELQES